MNYLQNFSEIKRKSKNTWITPSEIIEHIYCPRFTYFMHCLLIGQNEEQRYKVLQGREMHRYKARINKDYLRKKIGAVAKDIDVYLGSEKFAIRGIIDEVIELKDKTYAPLDYKFAQYKNKVYETLKYQSVMYALLIMDNYECEVKRGYICYIRSRNYLKEIEYKQDDFLKVLNIIEEMVKIIETNKFPKPTKYKMRCVDCCYRNICIK